jgi:sugar lactone lactonase YvrE/enterochelin esterase-like enzyme
MRLAPLLIAILSAAAPAAEVYQLGPDSQEHEGVPRGRVEKFTWTSKIFHGTTRNGWIYIPAQYDAAKPACIMIFQDGVGFVSRTGPWRVPTVFDNLINAGQMPMTIGVFLDPGVVPPPNLNKEALPRYNRSFEYDSPSDQYARFLLEEILPEVGKRYNLAKDGNSRAVCGISSGGICAFTAAWQRPSEFTRVLSFVGSFTNLRGGNFYPDVIRKTEPRAIRIFLQDGRIDLNNFAGDWVNANKEMADALQFAGYDYKYVLGDEGHNARHGGAILPDALRWLWRDYPRPVQSLVTPSMQPVMKIINADDKWEKIEGTYGFTEGPAADAEGNVYFSDIPNSKIYRISTDGKVTLFAQDTGHANGLMFGPDGRLYACQGGRNRVVAYDREAQERVIADGIEAVNDIAIGHDGGIYVTEPPRHQVWYISPKGDKSVVAKDPIVAFPNGVRLTPDQSQLVVADTKGVRLWIYQVHPDGKLANREAFFDAQLEPGQLDDGADGMTFDKEGRLYVCTRLGLQVFSPAGQVIGILNTPQQSRWLANVGFGGKNLEYLYVCNGDHVYRRKTNASGVLSWQAPVKPAARSR